ncbi:MAG: VWA domain-containing protein, partial [Oscillospiraceae bacterium]|nr:VWA domain-containing protein [Oscillospiraceae bacterium]
VGTLEVNPVSSAEEQLLSPSIPGYMGAAYDFSVDGEFDSAEITFAYDKSVGEISDTFQPRVYYFNEKTGMLEKLPNQKVENGKITVEVSHFSKYLVLNSVEFDLVWATEIRRPTDSEDKSVRRDMDVVFVIDESNSMENMKDGSNNDSKRIRVDATKKFIDNLEENDRVAIVGFADVGSERTLLSLSYDKADGKRQADNILGNVDGTAVHAGLKHALKELNANGRPESDKVIIAITDGVDSTEVEYSVYEEFIEAAKKSNVTLYTVGVGSDVDKVLLTNIAESLGGKYFHASTADDIYEGFEIVEEETIDFTKDSNEDGISDYYSRLIFDGVLRLSNGAQSFAFVDFGVALDLNDDGEISSDELANPDIDGDGILNGDELVVVELDGKVFLRMLSNPLVLDSDGDGYKDYEDPHLMFSDYLSKNVSDFRYITDNTEFEYSSFCNTYTKDFWAQAGDSFVRGITFTNMQKEYTQQLVGFLGDSLNIDVIQDSGIDSFDDICTEILNHEILQYTEAGFDLIGLVGEGGELLSTKEIAEITDAVTGLKTFSSTKMLGLNPDVLQELFALGELKKNAMFKLDEARELGKSAKSISGYQSWVTRYSNQIDDLIPNLTKKFDVDIADSFNSTKKLTLTRKTPSKVFDALDKVGKIADVASVGITLFDGLCTTEQIIDMTSGLASYNGEIDLLNTYGELFHYLANHATSNFTKSAARFVLNSMGEGFAEVLCQISQNLLLTGADVAFQLISIVGLIPQPFGLILGVAKFVFDVCDMIFGFTEKAVTRGKMVCIYDLSNALSTMVNRYYLLDDALKKHESTEYSFVKYVRMLMESRIIGENHYLALNKGDSEALANIAEVEALAKKMNLTLVIH